MGIMGCIRYTISTLFTTKTRRKVVQVGKTHFTTLGHGFASHVGYFRTNLISLSHLESY
jgi:hypothetical protein